MVGTFVKRGLALVVAVAALFAVPGTAAAGMVLTAAGTAQGLNLTTFASGFSNRGDGLGPIGIGFAPGGNVLVSVEGSGPSYVYNFLNANNGQSAGSVSPVVVSGNNTVGGIAQIGNTMYMAQAGLNQVVQLNANGTPGAFVAAFTNPVALAANPNTGHLFVSTYLGAIYDLNPSTGVATVLNTDHADGLTYDPTTNTLYAAQNASGGDNILGFNATTGAQVFNSGSLAAYGDPDGTAVGYGALAGNLFVNTNQGTLVEINLTTLATTLIASGGSRGDLVNVDPNDGSLFITQTDSVLRLTGPSGSGFGRLRQSHPPWPCSSSAARHCSGGAGAKAGGRRPGTSTIDGHGHWFIMGGRGDSAPPSR